MSVLHFGSYRTLGLPLQWDRFIYLFLPGTVIFLRLGRGVDRWLNLTVLSTRSTTLVLVVDAMIDSAPLWSQNAS